jgi:hypothetical protein
LRFLSLCRRADSTPAICGPLHPERERDKNQHDTEAEVHDDCVPKGMTDGHIVVIGHYCKEKIFYGCENYDKANLDKTSCVGDVLILCFYTHRQLWDCDYGHACY